MLLNSKEQLIVDHMNAIANFFGGWNCPTVDAPKKDIINTFNLLLSYEQRCHEAAEVLCDGAKRGIYFQSDDKQENVLKAEEKIMQWQYEILRILSMAFKDKDKVKDRFFVNTDPRGYALKITLHYNEGNGIYFDWGHYGIICPEIELKSWEDDNDQMISRYIFN